MESSEDDAGAATNASRRVSAREKDVGGSNECGASGEMLHEPAEPGAASEPASGSEEAFDADSVPSPSAQDVNTSTEAILDMIDEIVDGPDAPKRRSLGSRDAEVDETSTTSANDATVDQQAPTDSSPQTSNIPTSEPATSAKSEIVSQESVSELPTKQEVHIVAQPSDVCLGSVSNEDSTVPCPSETSTAEISGEELQEGSSNTQTDSTIPSVESVSEIVPQKSTVDCTSPQKELPECEKLENVASCSQQVELAVPIETTTENTSSENVSQESGSAMQSESVPLITRHSDSPQTSSSVPSNEIAESTSQETTQEKLETEPANNVRSNIPSSSVTVTVQTLSDSSENRISERTIKCVTSSDNRDNVTVESAESTSSDSSVSESRSGSSGATTRSPLRRRLVRPAPSDRRPDSTVSSTVDSQTVNICTTEQSTSECVAKDVTSSSDAVSSVYDNVKPEEIRNVSEISVCKAETSMSPPKKIKLIRQKVTPMTAQRDAASEAAVTNENDQCQSTSEFVPSTLPGPTSSDTSTPLLIEERLELDKPSVSDESNSLTSETVNESIEQISKDIETLPQPSQPRPPTPSENVKSEDDSQKKVPPIKLNLSGTIDTPESKPDKQEQEITGSSSEIHDSDSSKQVPKLTIKLGNKQSEEVKSPIPKLTIKPIRSPLENDQVPSITKLNIKPIPKPAEKINDVHRKSSSSEISESESSENDESNGTSDQASNSDQGSSDIVPKVTIKVGKPGTESEGKFYTEQNAPKLLIKGINPNETEEQESGSKLKLVISPAEDKSAEKIPKLTIKTVTKSEGQPLSPKLTIKPIKPPENIKGTESAEGPPIPKMKISTDSFSSTVEVKENSHVPKITIKPVVKMDTDTSFKTPKKSAVCGSSSENIPVVTKLNIKPVLKPLELDSESKDNLEERVPVVSKLHIKPIIKPIDSGDTSEEFEDQVPVVSKLNIKPIVKPTETGETSKTTVDNVPIVSKINIKPILKPTESCETSEGIGDKVPVVSKLNIKPIIKPKDNEDESSLEDIPKVTKLNIKPLRNPEAKTLEEKDCDELNADTEENSIPVVTKLNIKPIVKPVDEDTSKDSENQSSETGNSSDDNTDHIPVVTKINIKPIIKPNESEEPVKSNTSSEEFIPAVPKLNIKRLMKPDESKSPGSPKRDSLKITKLNIKPVLKPEEVDQEKAKREHEEAATKNPPLVMKINIKSVTENVSGESLSDDKKVNNIDDKSGHMLNNVEEYFPKVPKLNIKSITKPADVDSVETSPTNTMQIVMNCKPSSSQQTHSEAPKQNCISDIHEKISSEKDKEQLKNFAEKVKTKCETAPSKTTAEYPYSNEGAEKGDNRSATETMVNQVSSKSHASLQNCTLLKKLLETKKDGLDKRLEDSKASTNFSSQLRPELSKEVSSFEQGKVNSKSHEKHLSNDSSQDKINDACSSDITKHAPLENICKNVSESVMKPLEISISDKISNQSSGQDSPRIILKINKTDHGASAKIITEEPKRSSTPQQNELSENTQQSVNDNRQVQKRVVNSRKKPMIDTPMPMGKRLRSSRIVESTEKSPVVKRNAGKRPNATETSPTPNKEPELSVLESKRLKLGQLLSNKSLGNTPVKPAQVSPTKSNVEIKQPAKSVNHSLLNNENCSKNGNSKLHNILSNLQAKQAQALAFNDLNCSEKISITPELESNASTGSSDVVEIVPVENSHPEVQEMLINENSESHDFTAASDDMSQDPLEVAKASEAESPIVQALKTTPPVLDMSPVVELAPPPLDLTPQPKKRGRPRKLPVSEGAKPAGLPVPALEERPQRSLRLSRDRPAILVKPRGRGRGRGAKRAEVDTPREDPVTTATRFFTEEQKPAEDVDPTSSRIKLPRMTEALDKLPGGSTPLTGRRRSSNADHLFDAEPKVVLNLLPKLEEALKSPETPGRGRGGRGSRGGRGRGTPKTPRGRGRGRGGGRGAQYMKETMGIYGRVCGPATTTVQLFEEETCMMDDNATPAKPSHLLDEDSQSSVKSATNDSCSMKKSKFADLFDSNKVWTAADVKEYTWPPPETPDVDHQVMMIQEQVAMFLGVKSFKRAYPELARRAVAGAERDHVLRHSLVTEALCDRGITAVEASEVLDIMLSDYPHKYEEYRAHQRQRQLEAESSPPPAPSPPPPASESESQDVKMEKIEMKVEKAEVKPEPPKVDLEKTRQEALAAAIASASEWNARSNALRRAACVDLQSQCVHVRRAPAPRPALRVRPPAGFYPHALLPGQYQHSYPVYTPDQLRYFPLNTVVAAPPAPPPSDSESEPGWGTDSSSGTDAERPAHKRKKLTKTKRPSQAEVKEEPRGEVELCRVCNLRLEANRKYTHERFLVCANCNAKLHPGCVELSADTIRKCREYGWQCAECKTCGACAGRGDDDKMLFCDLCDRGFHIHCVGLDTVPSGRWHCVECAVCKSCGARDPSGPPAAAGPAPSPAPAEEARWHHQTKRGPGGHKIYSHSLCTPCARAYRIGRYCPLCERSFIGPKGTMQLVICKLCDRQHHQECVRQLSGGGLRARDVLAYSCGACRRGRITSRAQAVRAAPRTIATLFMAKRRFNKYAHRQYLQARRRQKQAGDTDAVADTSTADVIVDETSESCEPCETIIPQDDVSDTSDAPPDASDPLDGIGDETASAVAAIDMDF